MTKLKKGVLAYLSAVLLLAVLFAGVSVLFKGDAAHAENAQTYDLSEKVQTLDSGLLKIESGKLTGFNTEELPEKFILVIPSSVTAIADNAFTDQSGIIRVELPAQPIEIADTAFRGCTGIVEVVNPAQTGITPGGLTSTTYGRLFYYAISVVDSAAKTNLSLQGDFIFCEKNVGGAGHHLVGYVGGETVTLPEYGGEEGYVIHDYAFWNEDIKRVVIAEGTDPVVTAIGNNAFALSSSLTFVELPDTVREIGVSAFQWCSNLSQVNIPENIVTINDYAFSECGWIMSELVFPASLKTIADEAFYNCVRLPSISFEEIEGYTDDRYDEDGLVIERGAFRNCVSLTVITLPKHLSYLWNHAFSGCTAVKYAYLPDFVRYRATLIPGESAAFFDMNTWLVYPHVEALDKIAMSAHIINHSSRMTYLVSVNFRDSRDGLIETYQRLVDRPYDLQMGADGNWSVVQNATLFPVQSGYVSSVWFTDEKYRTVADVRRVTELLSDAYRFGQNEITLYARYTEKPEFTVQTVNYKPGGGIRWQDFVPQQYHGVLNEDIFKIDFNGQTVLNAGSYTLRVALQDNYGVWAEAVTEPVTVNPLPVNLATDIKWVTNGNELGTGTVYEYSNGSDVEYSQSGETPAGYTRTAVHNASNAIARYVGSNVLIAVEGNASYSIEYGSNLEFGGAHFVGTVQEEEVGAYTAYVLLNANPNYTFLNMGGSEEDTTANIRITGDGMHALVRKSWYILMPPNALYTDASQNTYYTIGGWTYNDAESYSDPAAPVLQYGNNAETYSRMTFNLTRNGVSVAAGIPYSSFENYINYSMPAGEYQVIFRIPQFTAGGVTYYEYYTDPYNFTVSAGVFKPGWKTDIEQKLVDTAYVYVPDVVQLYSNGGVYGVALNVWGAEVMNTFNPVDTLDIENNYWRSHREYFSQTFVLTYNLLGMSTNRYYTYGELSASRNLLSPVNPGEYTVYYQLTALNYKSLTDESDDTARREYSFTVTIYDEIPVPVVGDINYAEGGSSLYVEPSEYYTITYVGCADNNPVYTEVAEYTVRFTLGNSAIHRWAGSNGSTESVKDVKFNVNPSRNEEIVRLSIVQWSYGSYNAETNRPVWAVYYEDKTNEDFYSYKLIAQDGTEYEYADFFKAPNGSYKLKATAAGTKNWLEAEAEIDIYITKGINSWRTTPSIMQWSYKNFNKDKNTLRAEALIHTQEKHVIFTVTTDADGKKNVCESFYVTNGKVDDIVGDVLNGLTSGTYYLWAEVEETELYNGIPKSSVPFEVTKANNYWDEAPTLESWIVGRYDPELNIISARPHYGTDLRYVITKADDENEILFDSSNGINELAKAKVGLYVLKVSVAGSEDFEGIEGYTFLFNVFEQAGMPWWGTLLIVLGVVAVLAIVMYILHQKGILQLLTGKMIIAIRTRVTVDATIAAVKAQKIAEQSRRSLQSLNMQEARRRKREEQANMTLEEQAAALDEKARETAEKAEKLDKRATNMQKRANKLKKELSKQSESNGTDNNNNGQNPGSEG